VSLAYCVCGTAYAPDLDECPHCGSTDTRTEEYHVNKITDSGVSHVAGDEPTSWQSDLAFTPGRDISPHDPLAQKHVPAVSDPVEDPYEKVTTVSADGDNDADSDTDDSHDSDQSRVDEATGVPVRESDESSTAIRPDEPVRITPHDDRTTSRPTSENE
jgi:RNA polymerase subunit RPABC4/transcription elongation factor Spt4